MKRKKIMDIGIGYMDKKGNIYHDEIDLACHFMTKKQYREWYEIGEEEGPFNSYLEKWIEDWEIIKPKDVEDAFEILLEWGIII